MLKLSLDVYSVTLPDKPAKDENLVELLLDTEGGDLEGNREVLEKAFDVAGVHQHVEEFLLEGIPETYTAGKYVRIAAADWRVVFIVADRVTRELEIRLYETLGEFFSALSELDLVYPGCAQLSKQVLETKE